MTRTTTKYDETLTSPIPPVFLILVTPIFVAGSAGALILTPRTALDRLEIILGPTNAMRALLFLAPACVLLALLHIATLRYLRRCSRRLWYAYALARIQGTSWFADIRLAGQCELSAISGLSEKATQRSNALKYGSWTLFAIFASVAIVIGFGYFAHKVELQSAAWSVAICALAACFGAVTGRRISNDFPIMGPQGKDVSQAASLHLQFNEEHKEELRRMARRD